MNSKVQARERALRGLGPRAPSRSSLHPGLGTGSTMNTTY